MPHCLSGIVWFDWLVVWLIHWLTDCLNAFANCKLLCCSMWATVDGIHRSALVIRRSQRQIQDSGVMSGLLRHRAVVCSRWFQIAWQLMLASQQSRPLKQSHYHPTQRNEPVPIGQDLPYDNVQLVIPCFDCFIEMHSIWNKEPHSVAQ